MSNLVQRSPLAGERIAVIGRYFVLYALAVILIWVGGLRFAAYEAMAVQGLVTESPLLSWVYDIVDVQTFARILGVAEILAGLAIAFAPRGAVALGPRRRFRRRTLRRHPHVPAVNSHGLRTRRLSAALSHARTVPRQGPSAARGGNLGCRRLAHGHEPPQTRPGPCGGSCWLIGIPTRAAQSGEPSHP